MIITRYAVCSESQGKPVTHDVFDTQVEAEQALEGLRQEGVEQQTIIGTQHWIAELGAECEGWRWLAPRSRAAS